MATTVTEHGNVRIITQVVHKGDPRPTETATVAGPTSVSSQLTSAQIKNSKNTLTKALGVMQIILGATQISFGIALTVPQHDVAKITARSGVYFWIGILLLLSGSLLVEKERRERVLLVKISFFMNLLISVAALIAIILHSIEISQEIKKDFSCPDSEYYCSNNGQILLYGVNGVFIILSVLELSMAIVVLVIAFRFTRPQFYRQMAS